MSELSDEVKSELRERLARGIREGFDAPEGILESIVESLEDDGSDRDALDRFAGTALADALAVLREEQRTWPAETDCDRLDRAFRELDRAGIVARRNFTCCQTCGGSEIGGEMQAALERGASVRGYTYYHWQDTESAVEGRGLCLAYGAASGEEGDGVAVGHEVVDALARHGLRASWSGDFSKRIQVPMDWKRRAPPAG